MEYCSNVKLFTFEKGLVNTFVQQMAAVPKDVQRSVCVCARAHARAYACVLFLLFCTFSCVLLLSIEHFSI